MTRRILTAFALAMLAGMAMAIGIWLIVAGTPPPWPPDRGWNVWWGMNLVLSALFTPLWHWHLYPPARMGADISLPDGEEATRPGEGARPGA